MITRQIYAIIHPHLKQRNFKGAYHFALFAEQAFHTAEQIAPQWRAAYEQTKENERENDARKKQATEETAPPETEEEEKKTLPPPAPRPLTAIDQELQGVWQVEQMYNYDVVSKQWKEVVITPETLYQGTNNYYFFVGDHFCYQGFLTVTSQELICRQRYLPYRITGTRIEMFLLSDNEYLTFTSGVLEDVLVEIDTGKKTKLLFTKRPALKPPAPDTT